MCNYNLYIWEGDEYNTHFIMAIDTTPENAKAQLALRYSEEEIKKFGEPEIEELSPYLIVVS